MKALSAVYIYTSGDRGENSWKVATVPKEKEKEKEKKKDKDKDKDKDKSGDIAQMVECVLCMHEALGCGTSFIFTDPV